MRLVVYRRANVNGSRPEDRHQIVSVVQNPSTEDGFGRRRLLEQWSTMTVFDDLVRLWPVGCSRSPVAPIDWTSNKTEYSRQEGRPSALLLLPLSPEIMKVN